MTPSIHSRDCHCLFALTLWRAIFPRGVEGDLLEFFRAAARDGKAYEGYEAPLAFLSPGADTPHRPRERCLEAQGFLCPSD